MQVNVAFRHMDPSESVQNYASSKLEHVVAKYVSGEDVDSQITFSVEKFWHIVNFTLNINGLTVKSVEKTDDMYSSIDLALDKIERQVKRYRSKIRDHRPDLRHRSFTMKVLAPIVAEDSEENLEVTQETPVVSESPAVAAPETSPPVKLEQYTAPFMKISEAMMQLDLRHSQFFVFTNEETERINIIYRRDDGLFGLIEAEASHH